MLPHPESNPLNQISKFYFQGSGDAHQRMHADGLFAPLDLPKIDRV